MYGGLPLPTLHHPTCPDFPPGELCGPWVHVCSSALGVAAVSFSLITFSASGSSLGYMDTHPDTDTHNLTHTHTAEEYLLSVIITVA